MTIASCCAPKVNAIIADKNRGRIMQGIVARALAFDSVAFVVAAGQSTAMDLLVVGPVVAASLLATLVAGKAMLRGVFAVMERRPRG
jgi:hypothetical protein